MPDVLTWVDPDGALLPFDGSGLAKAQALWGIKNRLGAKHQFLEQELPLGDGSVVLDSWVTTGEWTMPFDLRATSEAEMREWLDMAAWSLSPLRGQGKLRSARTDGSGVTREFDCYLKSSLDSITEDVENGFAANAPKGVLVFRGGPYWVDITTYGKTYTTSSSSGSWFPVRFPWYLADSTIFATDDFDNPGHVPAWPLIVLQGPATKFTISKPSTGEFFTVTYDLQVGDSITLDWRSAGLKTATLASGVDLLPFTSGTPFALTPRTNGLKIAVDSSTSDTSVSVSINPRYYTP